MKLCYVYRKTTQLQDYMYSELNTFSRSNKVLGRLCSVPVSVLDVAIETLRTPLQVIENVALFAFNLIGAAFSKECSLKDALQCAEWAVVGVLHTPVAVAFAPLKVIYQLFAIIIDPVEIKSINPSY